MTENIQFSSQVLPLYVCWYKFQREVVGNKFMKMTYRLNTGQDQTRKK